MVFCIIKNNYSCLSDEAVFYDDSQPSLRGLKIFYSGHLGGFDIVASKVRISFSRVCNNDGTEAAPAVATSDIISHIIPGLFIDIKKCNHSYFPIYSKNKSFPPFGPGTLLF